MQDSGPYLELGPGNRSIAEAYRKVEGCGCRRQDAGLLWPMVVSVELASAGG